MVDEKGGDSGKIISDILLCEAVKLKRNVFVVLIFRLQKAQPLFFLPSA